MATSLPQPPHPAGESATSPPARAVAVRRLLPVLALAVCLVVAGATAGPADADTAPFGPRHATASHVSGASPFQHTCDDPTNPCYTAPQMHTYFVHRTHRFYHLSPKFHFPASFIHLAQAAHATWCRHHPTQCRTQRHQRHVEYRAAPNNSCGPGWWCHQRQMISCAGGGIEPYWSCDGAYHDQTAQQLNHKLSTTDKVMIVGADTMLCFLFPPGAPMVLGTGAVQMFNAWITMG